MRFVDLNGRMFKAFGRNIVIPAKKLVLCLCGSSLYQNIGDFLSCIRVFRMRPNKYSEEEGNNSGEKQKKKTETSLYPQVSSRNAHHDI